MGGGGSFEADRLDLMHGIMTKNAELCIGQDKILFIIQARAMCEQAQDYEIS